MIPVKPPPEPANFHKDVREPGLAWLKNHSKAKPSEYKDYWTKVRQELQDAFDCRCGYLGYRIPRGQVDHFHCKADYPHLVYEWRNYRYADPSVNAMKGRKNFLDPYLIQDGWVDVNPKTLEYIPGEKLPDDQKSIAVDTFKALNHREILESRRREVADYKLEDPQTNKSEAFKLMAYRFPLIAKALHTAGFFA